MAGMGEKPAQRSGPYALMVWTWAAAAISMASAQLARTSPPLPRALLVAAPLLAVAGDLRPGEDRVTEPLSRLSVHLEQHTPHVRVADSGGGVGVPGERRAAGAAAWFVLGTVGADGGVVGLLRLPRDDAVLDVDLPRAGTRAVHPVGRADHLVVAPAVAVEHVSGATTLAEDGAAVVGLVPPGEEAPRPQQPLGGRPVDSVSVVLTHTGAPGASCADAKACSGCGSRRASWRLPSGFSRDLGPASAPPRAA